MVGIEGMVAVGDGLGVGVIVAVGIGVFVGASVAVLVGVTVGIGVTAPHPTKLTVKNTTNTVAMILFTGFNVISNSILFVCKFSA